MSGPNIRNPNYVWAQHKHRLQDIACQLSSFHFFIVKCFFAITNSSLFIFSSRRNTMLKLSCEFVIFQCTSNAKKLQNLMPKFVSSQIWSLTEAIWKIDRCFFHRVMSSTPLTAQRTFEAVTGFNKLEICTVESMELLGIWGKDMVTLSVWQN